MDRVLFLQREALSREAQQWEGTDSTPWVMNSARKEAGGGMGSWQ
jgi:hypothetical protein